MRRKSSLEHNQQSPANLPRTVYVCETEENLDNLFESEGLLTDSLQSKSILENEIIHNNECTGFLISSYSINCTFKPTKRSKYMDFPLLYNERHTTPIQYTYSINGMASLVDAIRKIPVKYNTLGQYRLLFAIATCSCKVVDRKERKNLMIKHRKKQYYKVMELSCNFLELITSTSCSSI